MSTEYQKPKTRDRALSLLNAAIDTLNLAKGIPSSTPAKAVFGSVSVLLTMIKVYFFSFYGGEFPVHIHPGSQGQQKGLRRSWADLCRYLSSPRSRNERREEAGRPQSVGVLGHRTVAEIQKKVIKQSRRNQLSRLLHAKSDQCKTASWRLELDRIRYVFDTELAINTRVAVSDICSEVSKIREEVGGRVGSAHISLPGESPPPPPRACFGRAELVERITGLAENLIPIALTGAGGIGKTSIALVVLNHDRIKERFGDDRRFIRCDQFPPSRASFLCRLSKVVGAGVDNPEDLTSLRPFLSSKEMFIVLDNVESILDPQGVNGQEIYEVVEELSRFSNICLAITSRITTIPPHCETIEIPTLSMEAGCDTFYRIYKNCERSDLVNGIIEQLEFHPLSVTLLATVAHQNKWDPARLAGEWGRRQTGMLQTEHKNSLAATIELSLASPLFKELGPHARELLEVVAFFPQGVDENNLDWLFPAIPDKTTILDKFYILSLTYRSNGFITMLAPLRDYFCPKDPKASPFLCSAKESYFARLSVDVDPNSPGFEDTHWIASEDVNVERLLDAFMFLDANSEDVLGACNKFMEHLYWHKPRQTVLKSKLEQLPDDHPSKPECLFQLSRLFGSVGNYAERKRLLTQALKLNREREDGCQVARTLSYLSDVNRRLGLREEGIRQTKEALVIHEGLDEVVEKAWCLNALSNLLYENNQFDAAEEAISHCIALLPEKGQGFLVCRSHRVLGRIYHRKGEGEKAIRHYKVALGIASSFKWHNSMFWIHHSMAQLFYDQHSLDEAQGHITQAKLHAVDNTYCLGRAMQMQARIWYGRRSFEDATPEAARAIEIFEKLGAVGDLDKSRALLRDLEQAVKSQATSSGSDSNACRHSTP